MTIDEAVAALDAINADESNTKDPEEAHIDADAIVLGASDERVRQAYTRCVDRTRTWWFA